MNNNSSANPTWADAETLGVVRSEVRSILESSPAFAKLPDAEKREIAKNMVKVGAYMANPDGLAAQELKAPDGGLLKKDVPAKIPSTSQGIARSLAGQKQPDAIEQTKQRLSQDPGFAGEDFQAGAVRQGGQEFRELVNKVNFPKFVAGLINGVFDAIVDASIRQMKAYGELLAGVAKSVDQFASDHITENNARDWLTQKYPDGLSVEAEQGTSGFAEGAEAPPQVTLVPTGDNPEEVARRISAELQLAKPVTDLSDPNEEKRLVQAARLQMARTRQQLLASMVMLGINRIVVTDGLIHAKVLFDLQASDVARRRSKASMYDRKQDTSSEVDAYLSPWGTGGYSASSSDHLTTVESSVDNTSTSKAEIKAKLSGEVRVNFKSDYFPMEKLANPQMIAAISGNAKPLDNYAAPGQKAAG